MTEKEWIAKLNAEASARAAGQGGSAALDACERVAWDHGLKEIAEGSSCRIYRTPDGVLVNLWIEGQQSERIEDGGLGFDDQTDWLPADEQE